MSRAQRVSVVVPAHDAETTVARAVRSALAQSHVPHEVVVVDDGSTDATGSQVESVEGPVRLVRQPQGGPSAARNAGVAATSGEWIAFLDADDAWHPAKLEYQLRHADGAVLVASDWTREFAEPAVSDDVHSSRISTRDILLMNRFQTSTVLLRRSAFDAAGGFDPSLDGVEDWDMWLRASKHGAVVKLDWPFVHYVDVSTGYSKRSERVYRKGLVMLERELGGRRGHDERAILAYHHLRWATAFWLMHDRALALACVDACRREGLLSAVPEATLRYLVPYFAWRADRRIRRYAGRLNQTRGGSGRR